LVAHEVAAFRVLAAGVNASELQGEAVGRREVPRAVDDQDRVRGRGTVEVVAVRVTALGELVVIVAAADDPAAGRLSGGPLADGPDDVLNRFDGGIAAVDILQ